MTNPCGGRSVQRRAHSRRSVQFEHVVDLVDFAVDVNLMEMSFIELLAGLGAFDINNSFLHWVLVFVAALAHRTIADACSISTSEDSQ